MNHFEIELSTAARRDFRRLPRQVQDALLNTHFPIIQASPETVGSPLSGRLQGQRSYHFGHRPQYRLLYKVIGNHILISTIATREEVYKRAKRHRR